jgi:hypothetical protein
MRSEIGQPIDRLGWFLAGALIGIVGLCILSAVSVPMIADHIKRGWFEREGKVYRIVPAEVRR